MRGAVADDFTGATDLAGNWRNRGLRTAVVLGVPREDSAGLSRQDLSHYDALVVAQKIRSIPTEQARDAASEAGHFLLGLGCTQIYDKYCSTFDSTPDGNIGPIADVLSDLTGAPRAVVVPQFPDAGRTMYQGHLFVGSDLLNESGMENHPLNPMRDSSVVRLMAAQTNRRVGRVPLQTVREGVSALTAALDRAQQEAHYIVVDAISNADLAVIAEATQDDVLITGGSGLALGLPEQNGNTEPLPVIAGKRVILSGSASVMTRKQVRHGIAHVPSRKVDAQAIAAGMDSAVAEAAEWAAKEWAKSPGSSPLIYSVADLDDVEQAKQVSPDAPALIEQFFALLAVDLSERGARQILVAGGETSGAVVEKLGVNLLDLGTELAPGVSWLLGRGTGESYNLVLKSGNFGQEDLFTSAWAELGK